MPTITRHLIGELAAKIQAEQLVGAVVDPIPGTQSQEGPNCGFYALSIVMDYWKAKGKSAVTFAARKRDVQLQGRDPSEAQAPSLRNLGKAMGALDLDGAEKVSTGGVFTAEQLATVARATKSFNAKIVTKAEPDQYIDAICTSIAGGIPPIVAFDVVAGDPKADQGGQHSHWGVVFGYFDVGGKRHFIATHGHGSYYRWAATELQQSNFALNGTRRVLPEEAKVKVLGIEGDKGVRVARPHWRSVAELQKFEESKNLDIKVEYMAKKANRRATAVLQNLAHHLICVYPLA